MTDLFDLTGATAIVTGSSRGIGAAITRGLVSSGAQVVGVSTSQVDDAEFGGADSYCHLSYDVSDIGGIDGLATRIRDEVRDRGWPAIGILINNAGIIRRADAVDVTAQDWNEVITTDLTSPFLLTQNVARDMLDQQRGKIIFIASLLSYQGGIRVPAYTAAKSGIRGLVHALANEWAAHGVNVNGIAPGYIETDNTEQLRSDPTRSAAILERIPAGRWGRAEDIVGAALFLSSPASDYIHGHVLTVDGGWLGR